VERSNLTKLFVKRLTNLDFSFLDPKRGLVGESWLIDIELSGQLNEQGMVLDFGVVKRLVKDYIDQYIDHCLLVPIHYQGCDINESGQHLEVTFQLEDGKEIVHRSIPNAVAKIPAERITSLSIRTFLLEQLQPLLPANVASLEISLYSEPGLEQSYQYSHGLRKHLGNCQRIAHGHRSGLQIYVDQKVSSNWQKHWFEKWQDIYIGTRKHLLEDGSCEEDACEEGYYQFEYQVQQGKFFLKLPKDHCYIIDVESTVENIAQHLAEEIAVQESGKEVQVIAYEGIDKGAIATLTV